MISVDATFKWNEKTWIYLQEVPEKIMRQIARETLDLTGSSKVTAYRDGDTEESMYTEGVKGDFENGFYIGNFTDYASYVYDNNRIKNWTNKNTKTKWFEYIWKLHGSLIINDAIKENKL